MEANFNVCCLYTPNCCVLMYIMYRDNFQGARVVFCEGKSSTANLFIIYYLDGPAFVGDGVAVVRDSVCLSRCTI